MSWQRRLLERLVAGELPQALDLPTGLGKTSVMALWLIALAQQMRDGGRPLLPRRLVYVVDRRAVVDQATAEAEKLAQALKVAPELEWMREALGLDGKGELPISTLRGRKADNRAWLADPAKPAIIVGTVDMTGSRLLFSGYGVSRRMRPMHAGMLGVDTLFVLDESHLVPPFQKLLEQIAGADTRIWPEREIIRPLKVLPLSATGESRTNAFTLTADDEADEVVRQRLRAAKRLQLHELPQTDEKDALEQALAKAAWALAFEQHEQQAEPGKDEEPPQPRMAARDPARAARIIVYVESRESAQKVAEALKKPATPGKGGKRAESRLAHVELFTGARRVFEREQAQRRLAELGFLAGVHEKEEYRDKPAFLVATSAAEVGIDLDADHMVGDVVELERMIQRFGRVNRLGELEDSRIVVLISKAGDGKKKDKAQERQARLQATATALDKLDGDASPAALQQLKEAEPALARAASTPPPLYPPLEPSTVEAWAMTSLREHTARPDIAPWLRGWVEEEAQATIIWRQHLPWRTGAQQPVKSEVEAFFRAAPPHLLEMLEAPASLIAGVLVRSAKRWKKALDKEAAEKGSTTEAARQPALVVLTPAGDFCHAWTLAVLAEEKVSTLMPHIAGRLLVAARELGGLNRSGLLDKNASEPPETMDATGDARWVESVGYRVRRLSAKAAATEEEARILRQQIAPSGDWRQKHMLVLDRNAEGDPTEWLVVETLQRPDGQEGEGPIAHCDYGLAPHLDDVAQAAQELAERLRLPEEWQEVLRLAGQWHDAGKNRLLWQQAAGNRRFPSQQPQMHKLPFREALAKTKGPFHARLLGGYRHEFGSLNDMQEDAELAALPQERRAIVMHLVAAHHGHARPLINAVDPAQLPSTLQDRAAEAALRFARLQRRFGPWGLAWLEALLRAADRRASAGIGTVHPCLKQATDEKREGTHG